MGIFRNIKKMLSKKPHEWSEEITIRGYDFLDIHQNKYHMPDSIIHVCNNCGLADSAVDQRPHCHG